jgi:histone H3/H4
MAGKKKEATEAKAMVVKSAVKEFCREVEFQCAGDLPEALDARVSGILKEAHKRAAANGRKTIRPEDL